MSQRVPNWKLEENIDAPRLTLHANPNPNPNSLGLHVPILDNDYEVAELTWQNGQPSMHGLGPAKPPTTTCKYAWEKLRAGGTLESIVNQATSRPLATSKATTANDYGCGSDELVLSFDHHEKTVAVAAASMDALVPCSNWPINASAGTCVSTGVSSCIGTAKDNEEVVKPLRVAHETAPEWSGRENSGTGRRESQSRQVMVDSYERESELGTCGFTSSSMDTPKSTSSAKECIKTTVAGDDHDSACQSKPQAIVRQVMVDSYERESELGTCGFMCISMDTPENTSSAKECTKTITASYDHDSVCQSKPQAMKRSGDARDVEGKNKVTGKSSSVSTKRRRLVDTHNQSERKRRDKINQRMMTLKKMIPNSSKTDKASILDEVIEYLKQLQTQVQMMKMNISSSMMLPMTLQQQPQMPMIPPMMGMGMGMGVMGMNAIGHPNAIAVPPVLNHAISAFMPFMPREPTVMPDLMSTLLACQSQPMTMEAYSRMAALLQQLHQPPLSGSKD